MTRAVKLLGRMDSVEHCDYCCKVIASDGRILSIAVISVLKLLNRMFSTLLK